MKTVGLFSKFNPNHVEGGNGSPPHGGTSGEFSGASGGDGGGSAAASVPNPHPTQPIGLYGIGPRGTSRHPPPLSDSERVTAAFHHWIHGDAGSYGEVSEPFTDKDRATIESYIDTHATTFSQPLYRGLAANGSSSSYRDSWGKNLAAEFKPGSTVKLGLSSFSSQPIVARSFGDATIRLHGGRGVNVNDVVKESYSYETEVLSHGTYRVDSFTRDNYGNPVVDLHQINPVSKSRVALFSKFNPNHVEGGHGSPPHGGSSGEFSSATGEDNPSASDPNPTPAQHEPLVAVHAQSPEAATGRSKGRLNNPDATTFSKLSPEIQRALTDKVASVFPGLTQQKIEANLEHLYQDAVANNPDAITQGRGWYADAHARIAAAATANNVNLRTAVGITAAMSPQSEWGQNIKLAEFVMQTVHTNPVIGKMTTTERDYLTSKGSDLATLSPRTRYNALTSDQAAWATVILGKRAGIRSDVPTEKGAYPKVAYSTGSRNIGKAIDIARGTEPDEVFGGHKVRSFFNNIMDPSDSLGHHDVTLDVHAVSAATGIRMSAKSRNIHQLMDSPSYKHENLRGAYSLYADAFRHVAAAHDMTPNQFQASLWLHWQKVRYSYPHDQYTFDRAATRSRYGVQPGSGRRSRKK